MPLFNESGNVEILYMHAPARGTSRSSPALLGSTKPSSQHTGIGRGGRVVWSIHVLHDGGSVGCGNVKHDAH